MDVLVVKVKGDLENQIRGLFKTFGQALGQVGRARGHRGFARRVEELVQAVPALAPAICLLITVHETVCRQLDELNRQVRSLAKASAPARRFMTVPGVGPVTALAFLTAIHDPLRFAKASQVGACLGLTPRRYQSGEIDRAGHISKCGDGLARTCLYEVAGVLLTKVSRALSPACNFNREFLHDDAEMKLP